MSSTKAILLLVFFTILLFVGVFAYSLFGPSPPIVVSKETTWLTEPLADDGLPDYAGWLLDRRGRGMPAEENAAVPFLKAMWPAELQPEHFELVCDAIGMDVPHTPGFDEPWDEAEENLVARKLTIQMLTARGIAPPDGFDIESDADYAQFYQAWLAKRDEALADGEGYPEYEMSVGEVTGRFGEIKYLASELAMMAVEEPWTGEVMPPLAEWVNQNARKYELLHEAARLQRYFLPSPTLLEQPNASFVHVLVPDVVAFRNAMRCLSMRAMFRLGEGDLIRAWSDVRAMHMLGNLVPSDFLVGELVLVACHGMANSASQRLLDDEALQERVARALLKFYQSQKPRESIAGTIDSAERVVILTTTLEFSGNRTPLGETISIDDFYFDKAKDLGTFKYLSVNWNIVLEILNRRFDEMVVVADTEDYTARKAALTAFNQEIEDLTPNDNASRNLISRNSRSEAIADIMAALLLPALGQALDAQDRHNSNLALMQTAAALALYRVQNDGYPESLDALVPDLLPELPKSAYHAVPLVYTKTDAGYLLVDPGPNGKDDGGSHHDYSIYKGYDVGYQANPPAVAKLLGEPAPPAEDEGPGFYELDPGEELTDEQLAKLPLEMRIPPAADDQAIRMPLPPPDWGPLGN